MSSWLSAAYISAAGIVPAWYSKFMSLQCRLASGAGLVGVFQCLD
jgi:hypothetical protein